MPQPTLSTDRLALVPLADEHLELEVALDADPEVCRFIYGRARTRAEVEASHAGRMAEARQVEGLGFWVGFLRAGSGTAYRTSDFVGWWELGVAHDCAGVPAPAEAELGYRLVRRHWGQGLATEGARELLRHAFEDLCLERVFAETLSVNLGSRGVMAALGMRQVRTFSTPLDPDYPVEGIDQGEVECAITRGEWLGREP